VVQKLEETAAQTVEIRTTMPAEGGAINAADALLHPSCFLPVHDAPKSIEEPTEVVSAAVGSC